MNGREVFTIYRCPECGWWEGSPYSTSGRRCVGGYSNTAWHFAVLVPVSVISVEEVAQALREAGIDAGVQYPEASE